MSDDHDRAYLSHVTDLSAAAAVDPQFAPVVLAFLSGDRVAAARELFRYRLSVKKSSSGGPSRLAAPAVAGESSERPM